MTSPLLLIDGHSLAFRSYYAFTKGGSIEGLRTSAGIPTNICFGFLNSLLQVIQTQNPQRLAIAFDLGEPTFRHKAYDRYKANRREIPDDFVPDIKNLQKLLATLNLPVLTAPGYEADDILGTMARRGVELGYPVKIVTGDQDLLQLVDDQKKISVLLFDHRTIKGSSQGLIEYHEAEVQEKLNIHPNQVIDYKALCGDSSDNIPGVKGIGEKTAVKLLREYPTLEAIYQNIAQIKGATRKKLETGQENAKEAQFLVTIKQDVPLEITLEQLQLQGFDPAVVKPLLEQLELNKFLKQIDQLYEKLGGTELTSQEVKELDSYPPTEDEDISFFTPEETAQAQTQETALIDPQIITTEAALMQLVEILKTFTDQEFPVAWDTETSDLNPAIATLVGIGCCWGENKTDLAYIPLNHTQGKQLDQETVFKALKPILESENYPKVLQNAKFDRLVFKYQGIELKGVVLDTMLASYVLHPDHTHNLTDLSNRYLEGITAKSYKDLKIVKGKTIADLSIKQVAFYCGWDVYATFCLVPKLQAELAEYPALKKLLIEVEQPLEKILAQMEYRGIKIDIAYLKSLSQQLEAQLQQIEQSAYEIAGETFNLNSPKQLSELLFEKLGLDTNKTRKMKTGYSTNQAVLEKLQGDSPIIDYILEHRTLSKLKSTYVDALPSLVNDQTGRVHTDFNQAVTATGRLSSSNPNLQNIPIRTKFSRQIRKGFIPREGWKLLSADYSQIELRILAHFSGENVLVEAYHNQEDVHTVTAKLLFDKAKVTPEERRLGKTINFGVIYGMGAHRFAREAGVSASEGKAFIEKYRQRYGRVFDYLETMKREAIAKGYVETLLNRRRYFQFENQYLRPLKGRHPQDIDLNNLPKLSQGDAQLLRAAANAPIQGSSADIIKVAMVQLQETLKSFEARLLLQVHDELVWEVPPGEEEELQEKISQTMENAVSLTVPLVVEVHTGENWMEAK